MGKKVSMSFASGAQYALQMYDYATQIGQLGKINHKLERLSEVTLLKNKGVKFSEKDLVFATKDSNGKVVWLEKGSKKSGLKHIVNKHAKDFKKVYGETAIPYGTYRVVITYSNAFQKKLPEILNVPLYEGIRIHTGNHKDDTFGCLILGDTPKISQTKSWVYNSKKNYEKFMKILEPAIKKGRVIIEITDEHPLNS